MQFARRSLLAVATTAISATAWTTSSTSAPSSSFLGRSVASRVMTATSALPKSSSRTSTGLHMLFGNLFGGSGSGSGGAFGTKINYNVLDHPGPELGTAAEQGQVLTVSKRDPQLAVATFAGGCFWGLELAYQRVPGVVYTAVGYTQGAEEFPTYGQVCSGATGHTEALTVYYDPQQVSYEALLDTFFARVDPTTVNGQGNDRGRQYRTGVYFHTPEQEATARARFSQEQQKFKRPIASELLPAKPFWPAEKYHQQYLEKGGRFGQPQDASKGATSTIRCYG